MLKLKNLFTTHHSQFTVKTIAFTLAETLIVMGVIGIVAALTLPNLNSSTGDKEKVAKVKKIYQNLNDAVGRAVAVYGSIDEWYVSDGNDNDKKLKRAFNRITEFMKITKTIDNKQAITADGCYIYFYFVSNNMIIIAVDIDGKQKGLNTGSKDIFVFEVYDNTVITPKHIDGASDLCGTNTKILGDLNDCASAWVINYGNMDYLKCKDKLSETVTSCN